MDRYVIIVFQGERSVNRAGTYFVPGEELFRISPMPSGLLLYGVLHKLRELGPDLIKQVWRVGEDGTLVENCTDATNRAVHEALTFFRRYED